MSKGVKRITPEHDSSFEAEENAYKKSNLLGKTPEKNKEKSPEVPEDTDMDEIKAMLQNIQIDINEVKIEVKNNNDEMKKMRGEIQKMEQKWKEEKEELITKLQETEGRLERLEKDKIKNNIVITGLNIDEENRSLLKQYVEKMLDKEIGIKAVLKTAYKINDRMVIAEIMNWEEKMAILKGKNKLKGRNIFIDSELTTYERKIQKELRDRARVERNKGIHCKVLYQKLIIDGKTLKWNIKNQSLEEIKNNFEATQDNKPKN